MPDFLALVAAGASVVGLEEVPFEKVSRYGIVKGMQLDNERIWKLDDLVEKPAPETAPSRLAIAGRYLLDPAIFQDPNRFQTPLPAQVIAVGMAVIKHIPGVPNLLDTAMVILRVFCKHFLEKVASKNGES